MNKKLIASLSVLLLIFTCVSISAATLETIDEGNFTIDVPTDAHFKNVGIIPAGVEIFPMSATNNLWGGIEKAVINGKYDKSMELTYFYVDFEKDSVANYTSLTSVEAFTSLIKEVGGFENSSTDKYTVFEYPANSRPGNYTYEIVVQEKGFLGLMPSEKIVVIEGDDLELLTEMADSVTFK